MQARAKLILSALFAFVIASLVLFAVCYQSMAVRYTAVYPTVRVEEASGTPASSDFSDTSHKRITMLRGFAYALGRRCRVWRRAARRPV